MLTVIYREPEQKLQINVSPFFTKITDQLLRLTVSQHIQLVYAQFKQSISPFITPNHFQLYLPSGEVLYNSLPLYFYINYGKHQQQFFCRFVCTDKIMSMTINQKLNNIYITLVLRVSNRKYKYQCERLQIIPKSNKDSMNIINQMIGPDDKVIIDGLQVKRIKKGEEQMPSWSEWISLHWQNFQNQKNSCIYICVDKLQ